VDALFADILEQGFDLRLQVTGRSMGPFIQSGDTVILREIPPGSLCNGDIIYYINNAGSAVLHRLISIEIKADGELTFITRGDALRKPDVPITEDRVMAKAITVEKVMPLIGPIRLDMDSIFCKLLNAMHILYRQARQKFIKRAVPCKVLSILQLKRRQEYPPPQ